MVILNKREVKTLNVILKILRDNNLTVKDLKDFKENNLENEQRIDFLQENVAKMSLEIVKLRQQVEKLEQRNMIDEKKKPVTAQEMYEELLGGETNAQITI